MKPTIESRSQTQQQALATEAFANLSASLNRCSKNVGIEPIVVAELKFGDVQRHIFAADLVERADNAALEDRPETLNRLRVNCADNVLAPTVIDCRVWESLVEVLVANPLIGAEQAD